MKKKFKLNKEEKFILVLFIISLIGVMFRLGYNQAIKDARLVSVNENTHQSYTVSYDGKIRTYSGDWVEEYKN